ncbi:hypothetical protein A3715_15830 [Oleiphilus sp. HI0009]|nr:hypothetical protein A3715_15830 [Oleiphilus sp. HI0009]
MLVLNPIHFANSGYESSDGDYSDEDRALFQLIREAWKELESWGDLPIGVAWGAYSQDVWMLSWLETSQHDFSRKGLIPFIAYIQWHETNGEPSWGISIEKLENYADEQGISTDILIGE